MQQQRGRAADGGLSTGKDSLDSEYRAFRSKALVWIWTTIPMIWKFRSARSLLGVVVAGLMSSSNTTAAWSLDQYEIETAFDDQYFVINGEKYQAQTYCLGWEQGEMVGFIDGSPYGACASAILYNFNRSESCEVWCE